MNMICSALQRNIYTTEYHVQYIQTRNISENEFWTKLWAEPKPLEIKQEWIKSDQSKHIDHSLDYSEEQMAPPQIWKTDQHERSNNFQPYLRKSPMTWKTFSSNIYKTGHEHYNTNKREQPFQTTTELFQGTNVLQDLVGEALPYYNAPLNPKTMKIFNDPLGKES